MYDKSFQIFLLIKPFLLIIDMSSGQASKNFIVTSYFFYIYMYTLLFSVIINILFYIFFFSFQLFEWYIPWFCRSQRTCKKYTYIHQNIISPSPIPIFHNFQETRCPPSLHWRNYQYYFLTCSSGHAFTGWTGGPDRALILLH